MSSVDPKLLEAYFRFMAEASKQAAQGKEFFEQLPKVSSPDDWAALMQGFSPAEAQPEDMAQFTEAYWAALGFVPKIRFDELRRQYLALKEKLELAEQEANRLRVLLTMKGQEEQAKEVADAWSETLKTTLDAQTKWWADWLAAGGKEAKKPSSVDEGE